MAGSPPSSGRPAPSPTRAADVSGRARNQTTMPLWAMIRRLSALSTAPPATDTTDGEGSAQASASTRASATRKAASPSRANSSGTVNPVMDSTSASESR